MKRSLDDFNFNLPNELVMLDIKKLANETMGAAASNLNTEVLIAAYNAVSYSRFFNKPEDEFFDATINAIIYFLNCRDINIVENLQCAFKSFSDDKDDAFEVARQHFNLFLDTLILNVKEKEMSFTENWIDIERFIIDLVDSDVTTPDIKKALKDKYKWSDKQAEVAYRCIVR